MRAVRKLLLCTNARFFFVCVSCFLFLSFLVLSFKFLGFWFCFLWYLLMRAWWLNYRLSIVLTVALIVLSVVSLFLGVLELSVGNLLAGNTEEIELLLISRLPRLMAILLTGMGLAVAGLIMQSLCRNKFVSPSTAATISSAQLGILLAILFWPSSNLVERAFFAFACALAGTMTFVYLIGKVQLGTSKIYRPVRSRATVNQCPAILAP